MTLAQISLVLPAGVAALLPADFLRVDLTVKPVWGLYSNTLAQVITQLLSHWIVYLHRNACPCPPGTQVGTLCPRAPALARVPV